MQCYEYLAAITAVAKALETLPGIDRKLPPSVIADWMAVNDIEAEDVLFAPRGELIDRIESLIRENQPRIRIAA